MLMDFSPVARAMQHQHNDAVVTEPQLQHMTTPTGATTVTTTMTDAPTDLTQKEVVILGEAQLAQLMHIRHWGQRQFTNVRLRLTVSNPWLRRNHTHLAMAKNVMCPEVRLREQL
jgi:hypothetical protein